LTFILARGIGKAFITRDVPRDVLHTLLTDALAARTGSSSCREYPRGDRRTAFDARGADSPPSLAFSPPSVPVRGASCQRSA
jgi:hypothetical protein